MAIAAKLLEKLLSVYLVILPDEDWQNTGLVGVVPRYSCLDLQQVVILLGRCVLYDALNALCAYQNYNN